MKRFLFAALVAFAWAGVAQAGVYHNGKYLYCYDCHTMHASQSHGYGTGTVTTTGQLGGNWLPNAGQPVPALLKGEGSAVCTACHDGQSFAPDVIDGAVGAQLPRSAGAFPTTAGGGGHALNGTAPPGGAMEGTLQCTSCHIQHGYNSYRNLGSRSNAAITPTVSFDTSNLYNGATDVFLPGFGTGYVPQLTGNFSGYYQMTTPRYQALSVTVGTGTAAVTTTLTNRLNNFCGQCHGTFHGTPGDTATVGGTPDTETGTQPGAYAEFLRHPTAGVYMGQVSIHGHSQAPNASGTANSSVYNLTSRVKVAVTNGAPAAWAAAGYGNGLVVGERASPMCISCHNAHGSKKPFGLRFLTGDVQNADAENGDGHYRNLCGQCHSQGAKTTETYDPSYTGANFP